MAQRDKDNDLDNRSRALNLLDVGAVVSKVTLARSAPSLTRSRQSMGQGAKGLRGCVREVYGKAQGQQGPCGLIQTCGGR